MPDNRLSLVIPLYNEEGVVAPVAEAILQVFEAAGEPLELVLVDNGSADGTGRDIDELAKRYPQVRKVRVEVNQGYGWGVLCGLREASSPYLGYMGGDGQILATDVLRVWQAAKQGNVDLCKARRVRRGDGPIRVLVTLLCNSMFLALFPVRTLDINGTPKILTRPIYESLDLSCKDWFLDAEIMIKLGRRRMSFTEVDVHFQPRARGISHVRFSAILEFLRNIVHTLRGGLS